MEETTIGAQTLAKAKTLVLTLIPYVLARFGTCETLRLGIVEATWVPC